MDVPEAIDIGTDIVEKAITERRYLLDNLSNIRFLLRSYAASIYPVGQLLKSEKSVYIMRN